MTKAAHGFESRMVDQPLYFRRRMGLRNPPAGERQASARIGSVHKYGGEAGSRIVRRHNSGHAGGVDAAHLRKGAC